MQPVPVTVEGLTPECVCKHWTASAGAHKATFPCHHSLPLWNNHACHILPLPVTVGRLTPKSINLAFLVSNVHVRIAGAAGAHHVFCMHNGGAEFCCHLGSLRLQVDGGKRIVSDSIVVLAAKKNNGHVLLGSLCVLIEGMMMAGSQGDPASKLSWQAEGLVGWLTAHTSASMCKLHHEKETACS
eukprot:1148852-Pelagomonas_calceolata.AAC.2